MNGLVRVGDIDWFVLDLERLSTGPELLMHHESHGFAPVFEDGEPGLIVCHFADCWPCRTYKLPPWEPKDERDF